MEQVDSQNMNAFTGNTDKKNSEYPLKSGRLITEVLKDKSNPNLISLTLRLDYCNLTPTRNCQIRIYFFSEPSNCLDRATGMRQISEAFSKVIKEQIKWIWAAKARLH